MPILILKKINMSAFEVHFINLEVCIVVLRIVWSPYRFIQTFVSLSIGGSFIVLAYNFDLDLQNLGINLEI